MHKKGENGHNTLLGSAVSNIYIVTLYSVRILRGKLEEGGEHREGASPSSSATGRQWRMSNLVTQETWQQARYLKHGGKFHRKVKGI